MRETGDVSGGPWVEVGVKVRYAETDAQRVVHHAAYIVWFEVGRTEYCEAAGYPYPRMEAEGTNVIVVGARATYRRAVRYGDTVLVRCRLASNRSRACAFEYEVLLPDGALAAEGRTDHVFIDGTGRLIPAPAAIREAFQRFSRS
jgi:acyl-CoA thioester hydrolase